MITVSTKQYEGHVTDWCCVKFPTLIIASNGVVVLAIKYDSQRNHIEGVCLKGVETKTKDFNWIGEYSEWAPEDFTLFNGLITLDNNLSI